MEPNKNVRVQNAIQKEEGKKRHEKHKKSTDIYNTKKPVI